MYIFSLISISLLTTKKKTIHPILPDEYHNNFLPEILIMYACSKRSIFFIFQIFFLLCPLEKRDYDDSSAFQFE